MEKQNYYQKMVSPIMARHLDSPYGANKDFHFHDNYELFLFLSGNATVFVEQSQYLLEPGNLLIFNSQEIHKSGNLNGASYERVNIHFHPSLLHPFIGCNTNLLECFENRPTGLYNITLLDNEKKKEYLDLSLKLINVLNSQTFGKDIRLLTILAELLLITNDIFSHTNKTPATPFTGILSEVMAFIDENLANSLSLDSISSHLSISKYYLSHQFKKQTGSSLYHYILAKKIALAKNLLAKGHSVLDVCECTGFNDYNNFIRTFKNYTGYPPGQYKKASGKV